MVPARLAARTALVLALLLPSLALAMPLQLGAEGRLTAAGGGPIADGKYGLVVSLYDAKDAVESLWSEAIVGVTVASGMFVVSFGNNPKNVLTVELFAKQAEVWLGVSVDGEQELTRQRLVSVPYAIVAARADSAVVADTLSQPIGGELVAPASISQDKLSFGFAGSSQKDGAATQALDLDCTACVNAGEIAVAAVGSSALIDGSVTTAKIALGAIGKEQVGFSYAGSESQGGPAYVAEVANGLKCTGCVGSAALADGAIVTAKLADGSVAAAKLSDGAVTTTKLADASVTEAKLADGSVSAKKLSGLAFPTSDEAPYGCDADHFGHTWANPKTRTVYVCNSETWFPILIDTIGTAQNPGLTCADIIAKQPAAKDGVYWLDPDGAGGSAAFQVWCDMTTDGGGWTLVGKTAGATHNGDGGVLDGHDTARWKNRQYFGDVTVLSEVAALGPAYEAVPFTDFMLRGLHDGTKRLAWRVGEKQSSLYAVFDSGKVIKTTDVLVGAFNTLDWRSGCGTGSGPDGTGPQFYGFNIRSDGDTTAPGLFNGAKAGWCAALAGWGRDNNTGGYTGGGLGADCQGRGHQMGRHYWGYGDGCNAAGWSGQSNLNSFYGHAFFVR